MSAIPDARRIPREVTRPEGCTCAGTTFHEVDTCALFQMDPAKAQAAVDAAEKRIADYVAALPPWGI